MFHTGLSPSRCSVLGATAHNFEHKAVNDLQSDNNIEINLLFPLFDPAGETPIDKRLGGLLVQAAANDASTSLWEGWAELIPHPVPKSSRYDKHEHVMARAGVRCRDETV